MAEVAAPWGDLKSIAAWTPLTALSHPAVQLERTLFRLSETQYLICPPYNERFERVPGVPGFIAAVLWAQHEGAARRAILMDIEADRPESRSLSESPPAEMLLPGAEGTYGSIAAELRTARPGSFLEGASYRVAKDGAFIHRNISAAPYTFFFRSREDDEEDPCYSIEYRLSGYKKAAEYAQSQAQQGEPARPTNVSGASQSE